MPKKPIVLRFRHYHYLRISGEGIRTTTIVAEKYIAYPNGEETIVGFDIADGCEIEIPKHFLSQIIQENN